MQDDNDAKTADEHAPAGDVILHAYIFDKNGKVTRGTNNSIARHLKAQTLAWVHLDAKHPDTRDWLMENVAYLDHLMLDALLADETRPRVSEDENGMILILRGVNLQDELHPEDMISIRLWVDPHRIISLERRPLKAVDDICAQLDRGANIKDAGDFVTALTTRLFKRMEPVIQDLDERTDTIEENIMENPDIKCRAEVIDIRKKAIILRRYIAPQKDVLSSLRISPLPWLNNGHKRALHENHDRVTRYVEDLDAVRERAQIVKDELVNALSDRMNRNMYVLSVIASIFLPLGFFTGLLGINVGGMPGAEDDIAFWIVCIICAVFSGAIIGLMKFLKWI